MTKMKMLPVCLLLLPGCLMAEETWRPVAEAGLDFRHTSMQEYAANGRYLLEESGIVPGIYGGLFMEKGDLRLGGRMQIFDGTIDYDGQTQAGAPFQTDTDTTYVSSRLEVEIGQHGVRVQAFVGHDYWYRLVKGRGYVGGAEEEYHWWSLGAAVAYDVALASGFTASPGMTVWRNMTVWQQARNGNFDTAHLRPGGNPGWRLDLPFRYALDPDTSLTASVYHQRFDFDHSPTVQTWKGGIAGSFIYQPEIRYRQTGFSVGLSKRF